MTTENLSLLETKHLVEKSRGKLTMMVLRDDRKFLVSIPEVVDSTPNSEDDRRRYSSSELEGKDWREGGGLGEQCGLLSKNTKRREVVIKTKLFFVSHQTFPTSMKTFPLTGHPANPPERNGHAGTNLPHLPN